MRVLPSLLVVLSLACAHKPDAPPVRILDEREVAALIPPKVADREGWAADVLTAIRLTKKEPTPERVCAVLAVIEQESGYQADPVVPNLPKIVRDGLALKLERVLGPLAKPTLAALEEEYGPRIDALRTERDLDRLFREIAPTFAGGIGASLLDDFNPVTTAGSMQVKVSFARDLEGSILGRGDVDEVRELIYTRAGGIRYGTARLIGYPASYDDITFRFADYNAGLYASRNAQFQALVNDLTGTKLVLDGDLLAYDAGGDVKDVETKSLQALLPLSPSAPKDARREKSQAFEDTDTWRVVRQAWSAKHDGRAPAYARMPNVTLSSPKLSRARTTEWFATNVKRRYDACRAKVEG